MKLTTGLVFLGIAFAAASADAQPADVLEAPLKGAPRVVVTDRFGQESIGRLVSWTGSSIVIRTNGAERAYAPGEAVRVDLRGDSLRNGFLIGAALGTLPAMLADCFCGGGARVGVALAGMAVYGAIGAGIDALIPGRSPLWRSGSLEKSARGLTFDLSPRHRRASLGWRVW